MPVRKGREVSGACNVSWTVWTSQVWAPGVFHVRHWSHTVPQTPCIIKPSDTGTSNSFLVSLSPFWLTLPLGAPSEIPVGPPLPTHLRPSTSLFWPLWNWPNYPVKQGVGGLARLRIIYNAPVGIWSWTISSYTTIPCPCRPRSNKKRVGHS
jgi:hypothetical protein